MKILKYKKMSKGRYKVTFDTTELILYENVILEHNLLLEKNITLELLEKIMEENRYYEVYDISLSLIEIKMRSEKELKESLEKKGFESNLIKGVLERLKSEGYINEKKYIEAYINDKVKLTSWGPYKIRHNLLLLDLNEHEIDEYLNSVPFEIWQEKLEKLITKKLASMKNKSLYMIKQKLNIDLYNLGYESEMIEELLSKINKSNDEVIEKDYLKALNKYSKKYDGVTLERYIKNYLYQKGYSSDEIFNILNK